METGFIRKVRLIKKCIKSHPEKQTIAIHIFLNISRSKGNPTMKFGRLIEHDRRKIVLEKSFAKCAG